MTYKQLATNLITALRQEQGTDGCAACTDTIIRNADTLLRELAQHPKITDRPIQAVRRALDELRPSPGEVAEALEKEQL